MFHSLRDPNYRHSQPLMSVGGGWFSWSSGTFAYAFWYSLMSDSEDGDVSESFSGFEP